MLIYSCIINKRRKIVESFSCIAQFQGRYLPSLVALSLSFYTCVIYAASHNQQYVKYDIIMQFTGLC